MTQAAQSLTDSALPPRRGDECNPQNTKRQLIGRLRPELLYGRYGLRENPFGVTPDPRYLYKSKTYAEARSSLIAGIECGVGFQALIAPPGMGKTTILLSVLELFKDVARTAFLFQIQGDSRDFLHYLLLDLGCDAHDSDRVRMQDALNQLLIREHRAGRHTIIVIDEAQSLDVSVLETIRLLSNFETPSKKLLQIILAGQPRLAQRLANPELAQLSQRLSILTTLIPFDLEDTRNYIEHRLRIAGYQGPPLFTPAGLRLIWERSRGVPRDINTLCFNALLLARAVEQKQVDATILQEVVADRDLNLPRLVSDVAATAKQETHAVGELTREIVDISHRATPAGTGAVPETAIQQVAAQTQVLTGSRAADCSVEEQEQKHKPPSTGVLSSEAAAAEPIVSRLEPQTASVANPVEAASAPIATEATRLEVAEQLQNNALEHKRQQTDWRSFTVVSVRPIAVALLVGVIAIHGTPRDRALSARAAASTSLGGAPTTAKKRAGPVSVTAIHYSSTPASTIVEIDLEREVKYESYRLGAPERVYVDLQYTKYARNFPGKSLTLRELAVSKMRVAERQPGVTRLALETKGFCEYSTSLVSDPTRLLIEIRPAQPHAALRARRM
jgi:type II secretory pathway predicted ATPase ExeA